MARAGRYTPRYIAFIGVMSALCVVGRYACQALPNIQPMTATVIFLALEFGFLTGLYVATLSLLVSNMMLGFGIWTVAQFAAFLAVILATGGMMRLGMRHWPLWAQAIFAALCGYLYGFVVSLTQAPLLGGVGPALTYWVAGLGFDTFHALGNAVFYLLLAPALTELVRRLPTLQTLRA